MVLQIQNGKSLKNLILTNVAFVPSLDTNLLSVKKLVEVGKRILFECPSCFIEMLNQRILLGTFINSAYLLNQHQKAVNSQFAMPCVHELNVRKQISTENQKCFDPTAAVSSSTISCSRISKRKE